MPKDFKIVFQVLDASTGEPMFEKKQVTVSFSDEVLALVAEAGRHKTEVERLRAMLKDGSTENDKAYLDAFSAFVGARTRAVEIWNAAAHVAGRYAQIAVMPEMSTSSLKSPLPVTQFDG